MIILDVGANIGWYSLLWGKKYPNSKIHAFEPIEETYNYLISNSILNGIKNVTFHKFGLSNVDDELIFYYNSIMTGLTFVPDKKFLSIFNTLISKSLTI